MPEVTCQLKKLGVRVETDFTLVLNLLATFLLVVVSRQVLLFLLLWLLHLWGCCLMANSSLCHPLQEEMVGVVGSLVVAGGTTEVTRTSRLVAMEGTTDGISWIPGEWVLIAGNSSRYSDMFIITSKKVGDGRGISPRIR